MKSILKDNDADVPFRSVAAKGFYMPDGVAIYKWRDCAFPTSTPRPATSMPPARGPSPSVVLTANWSNDSGSILDRKAHARVVYDDGRSRRDRGVEPEGVALLQMASRRKGWPRTSTGATTIWRSPTKSRRQARPRATHRCTCSNESEPQRRCRLT